MRSARRRKALILPTVVATLCLVPGLAAAQSASPTVTGPSTVERAVTLASPAVVFVDTSVRIHVRLIYQNPNAVSGLGSLDRTYFFDYATGSGFVVSPDGVVVTASHVVEPDQQSMRNYAANRLVLEGYGYSYPSASSSPFDQYTLPVRFQNQLLQQCYKGVACTFRITPIETVYSAVDIAQMQLPKGMPARVLASTGFKNTDVAILQVNGSNMPTVELADTATDLSAGDEVVALGFPGTSRDALETGVTEPNKAFGRVSNVRPQGTSNLIEVDANIQRGMSGGPVVDDSGKVVGLISFSLIQSSGESGAKYLRTVDDIKATLADAGVAASRGTVDEVFAGAMELFWGNHFTAAVPEFNKVLALYPGHPLATEGLADAQAKAGTAEDIPVAEPSPTSTGGGEGFPVWAIGAIAAVAVAAILLVMLTRRKRPAPAVAAVSPIAPPPSTVGTPAAPPAQEAARVGFQPPPAATAPPAAPTPPPSTVAEVEGPGEAGEARFCAKCGSALQAGMSFCGKCGHPVGA
ncbi:MAG: trypsin-like peptidase domain-containing protein [Actinomycetota bacterium]